MLKGANDTVDLELAVDVRLLLLLHHRAVHVCSHFGILADAGGHDMVMLVVVCSMNAFVAASMGMLGNKVDWIQ